MGPIIWGTIANVVSAVVIRTVGWSVGGVRKRARTVALRSALQSAWAPPTEISILSDARAASLSNFVKSNEFGLIASMYVRALLARQFGESGDELLETANRSLSDALVNILQEEANGGWVTAIESNLLANGAASIEETSNRQGLSPQLEAELAKTSAAIVARSGSDLSAALGFEHRAKSQRFAEEYRSLVSVKYSNMSLPHAGTTRRVPYRDLFVEPDVDLDFAPFGAGTPHTGSDPVPVPAALSSSLRTVIVGNPGGGKSTLSQKLVHDIATSTNGPDVPFFVVLRDYAPLMSGRNHLSVVQYLEATCRAPLAIQPPEGAIEYILATGRGWVIFDGLDELLETSLRRQVVEAVEGFANRYPLVSILVTSRRVGYEDAPLDSDMFPVAVLSDFSPTQVEKYASNWFALDESIEPERRASLTESFMEDSRFVSDLRANPLMLALMCGIYASERYIPKNRPDVYEKCANLLLDQWDRQRNIKMALPFDAHVQRAMRVLALEMYKDPNTQSGVSRARLIQIMTEYLLAKRFKEVEEAEDAATQFVDFCKGRAWVLSEVGSNLYSFTHRTFLEYFAASQLVQEHTSAPELYAELRADISQGTASIVHQLALQILGKHTEDGAEKFCGLVLETLKGHREGAPAQAAHEAQFLVAALSFLVPHPNLVDELMEHVVGILIEAEHLPDDPQYIGRVTRIGTELESAAVENLPIIQGALEEQFWISASTTETRTRALSLMARFPVSHFDRIGHGHHSANPWADWIDPLRTHSLDEALKLVPDSLWAATECFRDGRISIQTFVEAHGFGALYASDPDGSPIVDSIPVAVSYLLRLIGSVGLEEVDQKTTNWIAAEVLRGEPTSKLPPKSRASIASWAIYSFEENVFPSGFELLLALPVLEALSLEKDPSKIYSRSRSRREMPDWVVDLFEHRRGALAFVSPQLIDLEQKEDELSQLFTKWSTGHLNFFGDESIGIPGNYPNFG